MPFNGAGVFTRVYNWAQDAAASINIKAARMDTEDTGFATGLSNVICKDGQTTITANLPMAGFRHTGVGNASLVNQYAATGQVQNGAFLYLGTTSGTNTVAATATPTLTAYAAGQTFRFIVGGTNTSTVTLNIDALGAKAVQKKQAALVAGDLTIGDMAQVTYDGTQFQLLSPGTASTSSDFGYGGYTTNNYYANFPFATNDGTTDATLTANRLYAIPFQITEQVTMTRIGIKVTTLAAAANARLGIYNWVNGAPTTLVSDLGTVSTGTTGEKEITISQALAPGMYALVQVHSGAPHVVIVNPANAVLANLPFGADTLANTNTVYAAGCYTAFTYGALPGSFGTPTFTASNMPAVWLRKV